MTLRVLGWDNLAGTTPSSEVAPPLFAPRSSAEGRFTKVALPPPSDIRWLGSQCRGLPLVPSFQGRNQVPQGALSLVSPPGRSAAERPPFSPSKALVQKSGLL